MILKLLKSLIFTLNYQPPIITKNLNKTIQIMKNWFLSSLFALFFLTLGFSQQLKSPDENLIMAFTLLNDGTPSYSLTYKGKEVIGIFNVGLEEGLFNINIPDGVYKNLIDDNEFEVKNSNLVLTKDPIIFYR